MDKNCIMKFEEKYINLENIILSVVTKAHQDEKKLQVTISDFIYL